MLKMLEEYYLLPLHEESLVDVRSRHEAQHGDEAKTQGETDDVELSHLLHSLSSGVEMIQLQIINTVGSTILTSSVYIDQGLQRLLLLLLLGICQWFRDYCHDHTDF